MVEFPKTKLVLLVREIASEGRPTTYENKHSRKCRSFRTEKRFSLTVAKFNIEKAEEINRQERHVRQEIFVTIRGALRVLGGSIQEYPQ